MSINAHSLSLSGTFTDTRHSGTFVRTATTNAGVRTIDTVRTLTDGTQVTRDVTRTRNADGGFSRSVTTTRADGKTTTLQETATRQSDGSFVLSGALAGPGGRVQTLSGTEQRSGGTTTEALTYTNPAERTRTSTTTATHSGPDVFAADTHGTRYDGSALDASIAFTVLQRQ